MGASGGDVSRLGEMPFRSRNAVFGNQLHLESILEDYQVLSAYIRAMGVSGSYVNTLIWGHKNVRSVYLFTMM